MALVEHSMSPSDDEIYDEEEDEVPRNATTIEFENSDITNIEHPSIIKNVDNAIKSLGGVPNIDSFLHSRDPNKEIGVSLRPNDQLAKTVPSKQVSRHDVLLRITLPRRTGRKRKRGSNDPFTYAGNGGGEPDPEQNAPAANASGLGVSIDSPRKLLRALRDHRDRYSVSATGVITTSHRFRFIPDLQHATTHEPLSNLMRETLLTGRYDDIINFKLDQHRGIKEGGNVGPPAQFTAFANIPYNYSYRQGDNVSFYQDESGQLVSANIKAVQNPRAVEVPIDAENVPMEMPHLDGLTPEDQLDPIVKDCVDKIRKRMEERPIMTKRYLDNFLGISNWISRYAWVYCGYVFRHGPWKDALVKFGVDPRKDPECRHYQVQMYKLHSGMHKESDSKGTTSWKKVYGYRMEGVDSHVFDGKALHTDSRVWQVCDITDPFLRNILDNAGLRDKPDLSGHGWYWNGTMAKQQAIMRHKMDVIQGGGIPNDEHYLRILQFPDIMTEEGRAALRWENHLDLGQPTEVEMSIGDRIRNIAFHSVRSKGTRIRAIDTANVLNSEGRVEDVGMMDNDDDEDAAESMEDD